MRERRVIIMRKKLGQSFISSISIGRTTSRYCGEYELLLMTYSNHRIYFNLKGLWMRERRVIIMRKKLGQSFISSLTTDLTTSRYCWEHGLLLMTNSSHRISFNLKGLWMRER